MELGNTLRKLMAERGIRPGQLARVAEISTPYMSNLLHNDKSPSALILDRIARSLGVTVDDILHPEVQELRTPEKKYIAHCIRCHSNNSLRLIPHGADGELNGWVFACGRCERWVLGGSAQFTYTRPQRAIPDA